MRVLIAAVAMLMAPQLAEARECARWGIQIVERSWPQYSYRQRYCVRWVREEPTRVFGYERREEADPWREQGRRRDQCREDEIDVLSTEHQTEENAREAARKLWSAKTQWKIGGQWMDLDNAAAVRWRCGPSNAHDTVSGKLAETVGTLTGKGGQNVRCALWARPCSTERTPGDGKGRK